jgi:hypothetical protein
MSSKHRNAAFKQNNKTDPHSIKNVMKTHPLLLDLNSCNEGLSTQNTKSRVKSAKKQLPEQKITKQSSCNKTATRESLAASKDFYSSAFQHIYKSADNRNNNNNKFGVEEEDEDEDEEDDDENELTERSEPLVNLNLNNNCNSRARESDNGNVKCKYYENVCESDKKRSAQRDIVEENRCASSKTPDPVQIQKKMNRANKVCRFLSFLILEQN